MRAFEYRMELNQRGYRISNGKTIISYDNPGSEANAKSRGIKMSIMSCDDFALFKKLASVCLSLDRKDNSFMSCWQKALFGEDNSWKLANVWVRNHELMLDYINEQLYDEYVSNSKNEIDAEEYDCMGDETMPPYYARLEFYGDVFPRMQLCFETFSDDGKKSSTTSVDILTDGSICLTEIDDRQERMFDFQNEDWVTANTPVRIVECSW